MSLLKLTSAGAGALLVSSLACAGGPIFTGPTPYTSVANSPFFATQQVGVQYYLEDFEKGVIAAPGLSVSDPNVAINPPSATTDSVDLDDCLLNGSGVNGRSLANLVTGVVNVQFNNVTLGGYPTKAGFVWTDGAEGTGVTVTVIGALGTVGFFTFFPVGDAVANGTTGEDRFMGVELDEGIAQLQIAGSGGTIEIDHIQYSAPTLGALWTRDKLNAGANSDLLWHKTTNGNVAAWFMSGLVKGGGPLSMMTPLTYAAQGMGDFDGDGDADVLWRDTTSNLFYVWLLNGQSVVTASAVLGAGPVTSNFTCLGVGDTNGDKKADVVFRNTTTNGVSIWYMDGVTRTSGGSVVDSLSVAMSSAGLTYAGLGDFNGDGRYDIMWRNAASNLATGWLLNGRTVFANCVVGNSGGVPPEWVVGTIGDLDGDGRADVIWRNTVTTAVNGWLLNGLYRKTGGSIGNIPLAWTLRASADLNGDTKNDLIWTNSTTGQVNGWIMDGLTKLSGGNMATITGIADWNLVNR